MQNKPYNELKKGRQSKGKGREEPAEDQPSEDGDQHSGFSEIVRERAFLRRMISVSCLEGFANCLVLVLEQEQADLAAKRRLEAEEAAKMRKKEKAIAAGNGMECGCCFDLDAVVSDKKRDCS